MSQIYPQNNNCYSRIIGVGWNPTGIRGSAQLHPPGTLAWSVGDALMLHSHMPYHNDTIIKTQEDFFNKIYTSHFIVRVRKGYSRFACERELETEHNCNILTPTLMAVSVVSFLFSWCWTGGPAAQLSAWWWLSLLHLISIFSGPQLIRAPSSFGLVWLSLPHLVYNSASNCNCYSNWNWRGVFVV